MTPAAKLASAASAIAIAITLSIVAPFRAQAEDTGLWETFYAGERGFRGVAPAPSWFGRPTYRRVTPRRERAAARPKPPPVEHIAAPAMPLTPPDPSKRPNPFAALLTDPTLRRGDIVVFPDGARVFRGAPGTQHAMRDFAKVAASKDVPAGSRKALAALAVGHNSAWSSDIRRSQLAGKLDVESTGSIGKGKASRRRTR